MATRALTPARMRTMRPKPEPVPLGLFWSPAMVWREGWEAAIVLRREGCWAWRRQSGLAVQIRASFSNAFLKREAVEEESDVV